jgi:hypothetical protein
MAACGNPVGVHGQTSDRHEHDARRAVRAPLVHVSRAVTGIVARAETRDGRSGARIGQGFGDLLQLGAKVRNVL